MSEVEFLASILRGIVMKADSIRITKTTDEMGVLLSVSVDKQDMGKVIGKAGETAKCLRNIVGSYGAKHGIKLSVKILEP